MTDVGWAPILIFLSLFGLFIIIIGNKTMPKNNHHKDEQES